MYGPGPHPMKTLEDSRSVLLSMMDHRSKAMLAGYATGRYPIPLEKRAWAEALVQGLVASGEVPADHKGEIQIRLVFRGDSRAPDVKLGAVLPLN